MCIGGTGRAPSRSSARSVSGRRYHPPVVKGDETLGMHLGKVLTDADHGDAKGARQRALSSWYDAIAARASFRMTEPPGL
jgi:hypothetical protein